MNLSIHYAKKTQLIPVIYPTLIFSHVICSKRIYDDMNEIYSTERLLSSNSLRLTITDTFDIGKKITEQSDKFAICIKSHRYDTMNK